MRRVCRNVVLGIALVSVGVAVADQPEVRVEGSVWFGKVRAVDKPGETTDITLANGVRVITRRHGEAGGEVVLWLRVEGGSVYERDEERGAAHLVEHLALTGSVTEPEGWGGVIGENRNAYTNVDHASFWIVTDGSASQITGAIRALSTIVSPSVATREQLDREREVVLEEMQSLGSPMSRAQRTLLSGLFPGTGLDERWPSVEPEALMRLTPEVVNVFRERVYVPGAATLVAVGPVDAREITERVSEAFGPLHARHPATAVPEGLRPERGLRVVRAEEEGLSGTEVTIAWAGRANPEGWVTDALAVAVMRDRVKRVVASTEGWSGEDLVVHDVLLPASSGRGLEDPRLRLTQIGASFPSGGGSSGITTLAMAVSGMAQHPVTPDELARGFESVLAKYHRAVKSEAGRSALSVASSVASWLPRELRPEAFERLAEVRGERGRLREAQVTEAARALFDPERAVVLVQGPPGRVASSKALMAGYRLGVELVPREDERANGEMGVQTPRFFVEPPRAAQVERVSIEAGRVYDAVLDNGVVVRHREMATPGRDVTLRVTVVDAVAGERGEQVGMTLAAIESVVRRPATVASPGNEIGSMLDRLGMTLEVSETDGSIDVIVTTPAESLDEGAGLIAGLLSEPSVGLSDLHQWQARAKAAYDKTQADPALLAMSLLEQTLEGDPGVRDHPRDPETRERDRREFLDRIKRFTPEQCGQRLSEAAAGSRVIVTVVGECDSSAAVGAITGAFSALGTIEGGRAGPREILREPKRGALEARTSTPGDTAAMVLAAPMPRELTTREVRTLVSAMKILDSRLKKIDGLGAFGSEYPHATIAYDASMPERVSVVVLFTGIVGEIDRLTKQVRGEVEAFARHGPTGEELDRASRRGARLTGRALVSAEFWSRRLSTSAIADRPIEELLEIQRDYTGVTAEECRALVNESVSERWITIRVLPGEQDR